MTVLDCEFPDKIRFYHQVLTQDENRLFVETEANLPTGFDVEVKIKFASAGEPITARAKVVAKNTRRGGGDPGVWVQFAAQQIEAMRQALQIEDGEGANLTSRRRQRFECSLPVLVDKPTRLPFRAVNISQGGVCLNGRLPVPVGQTVRLNIEFSDQTVTMFGKVAWRRDDAALTGIELRFQNEQVRKSFAEHVRRIADEKVLMVYAKPTVLIVDDDLGTLRALERVLTHRGYGTLTATSGPEALAVARERLPALMLLDVLLPGMNGLEVCRALKRDGSTSQLPVILTSVLPKENLGMLLVDSGALVALPKPYRFETLATVVEQVLDQSRTLDAPSRSDKMPSGPDDQRVPVFEHCNYESDSLRLETHLREASETGGFIVSYWGERIGTRARLTIMRNVDRPVELEVEVVSRSSWGIIEGKRNPSVPGLGLRFLAAADNQQFVEWLEDHRDALGGKPVILVVDDDRAHLEILSVVLKKAGWGVVTVDSAYGVVNAVSVTRPALVILDYMMPGIDGARLCKTIKENPATNAVPVWLYSSVSEDHLEQLVSECGADDFVCKGAHLNVIVERIAAFLRESGGELS